MSGRVGSITTDIIADGLIFNMDAANRASYVELNEKAYNTIDSSVVASCYNETSGSFDPGPKAWNFDGIDAYIDMPQSAGQFSRDPMTLEWVWKKDGSATKVLLMDRTTYNGLTGLEIWTEGMGMAVRGSSATKINGTQTLSIDTWYHSVVTFNSTLATIYTNGVYDNSGVVDTLTDSTYNFNIGRFPTLGSYYWDGEIACLRMYNRALSANEVLHNYNSLKGRFGL